VRYILYVFTRILSFSFPLGLSISLSDNGNTEYFTSKTALDSANKHNYENTIIMEKYDKHGYKLSLTLENTFQFKTIVNPFKI